jgi:hypothetical protein
MHVARNLRTLAVQTLLSELPNELPHARPAEFAGNQEYRRLYPGMGDTLERGGSRVAELRRYERPKGACRHVAEQLFALYRLGCDEQ